MKFAAFIRAFGEVAVAVTAYLGNRIDEPELRRRVYAARLAAGKDLPDEWQLGEAA
jgi:uncharacterized protein (DUF736 family)